MSKNSDPQLEKIWSDIPKGKELVFVNSCCNGLERMFKSLDAVVLSGDKFDETSADIKYNLTGLIATLERFFQKETAKNKAAASTRIQVFLIKIDYENMALPKFLYGQLLNKIKEYTPRGKGNKTKQIQGSKNLEKFKNIIKQNGIDIRTLKKAALKSTFKKHGLQLSESTLYGYQRKMKKS